MSDPRKPFTESSGKGSRTGASSEPDLSIADFDVEPEDSGGAEPAAPVQESARPGFGVGRWLLLWLVITLGVTGGNLFSGWIAGRVSGVQLELEQSAASEASGGASATTEQTADENADGEESRSGAENEGAEE